MKTISFQVLDNEGTKYKDHACKVTKDKVKFHKYDELTDQEGHEDLIFFMVIRMKGFSVERELVPSSPSNSFLCHPLLKLGSYHMSSYKNEQIYHERHDNDEKAISLFLSTKFFRKQILNFRFDF